MTMLHDAAMGVDIKYKSEKTKPLLRKISRQWWRKKATRHAAKKALHEVEMLRERLSMASIECAEWRQKVGGAAYSRPGPEFMKMVEDGIVNRIGRYIRLTDEDF